MKKYLKLTGLCFSGKHDSQLKGPYFIDETDSYFSYGTS